MSALGVLERRVRLARRPPGRAAPRPPSAAPLPGSASRASASSGVSPVGRQLPRARLEDHLGRAFGIGDHAVRRLVQRRHALGLGGERDLVDARELRVELGLVEAGLGGGHDQRALGRVAFDLPRARRPRRGRSARRRRAPPRAAVSQTGSDGSTGCAVARELALAARSPRRRPRASRPATKILRDRHLVLGQRAGLVGADDRGAAERLDRGQAADQRVALDHPLHAERERDGDHGRQRLGHDGDRQRDAEDAASRGTAGRGAGPSADDDGDDHERGARQRMRRPGRGSPAAASCPSRPSASIRAILPNSVCMPVATTTARPRP